MTRPTHHPVGGRMALAREWDDLVARARELEGLEGFLEPPRLETLLPAATSGPVAVVNVSRWRCDALLVQTTGITTVPLGSLSATEVTDRVSDYLALLATAEQADLEHDAAQADELSEFPRATATRLVRTARAVEEAHRRVDEMLHDLQLWMWRTICEPILVALGFTTTPTAESRSWPRLWWCPTGSLTLLPLHTAGDHLRTVTRGVPAPTVIDRVVSSYTPTVRALLEARRPLDSIGIRRQDRLLLVDVAEVSGQLPLDTDAEQAALLSTFAEDNVTILGQSGRHATRDEVRAALPLHRWVHFSCHGDQDLTDPARGGLLLHDTTLTIADITECRFRGDFAGLAACKTAVGGVELLDEIITLAAAMHYTGYRHVIAALWSVDSQTSAEVFKRLYGTIAVDGSLKSEWAPVALHSVVRELRDRHPEWPHRWTPFAHIGP